MKIAAGYTITVTDKERELLRAALTGLATRIYGEIQASEAREAAGVTVQPFLNEHRRDYAAVQRMQMDLL